MTIGQTPENVSILILLALAYLPGLFLLIGLGALIRGILRIQSLYFSLGFILLLLFGPLVGASLYLDAAGKITSAQVTKREETIRYRKQGDWQHKFALGIRYVTANLEDATANFNPDVATFDRLHDGETISVRTVDVGRWLNLVRPAEQSTLTWLPWWWLGGGLGVLVAGIVLWRIRKLRFGYVVIVLVLLTLAVWPLFNQLREWQRSQNLSLTPLRATGTIQAVERVTEIDPLPEGGSEGWDARIDAPQPYEIVTVRFTPQGYNQSVLGVDAVDANSVDANSGVMQPNTSVEVAYSLTEPRMVRLRQGTRTHYWKNPVGWVQQQFIGLLLVVVIIVLLGWLWNRGRKWLKTLIEQAR